MSPYPNITPDPPMGLQTLDPQGAYPPDVSKDSMTKMMEEIVQLCSETTECIRGFAEHRAATNARMRRAQQNREEEKKDRVVQQRRMMQMEGVIVNENEEIKEPAAGGQHIIEAPTPPANVD
jgi:hypothetical protein